MSDTVFSVGALVAMAYFLSKYHKESVEFPSTSLPLQSTPDVRRWKHDGSQPTADHNRGNLHPSIEWPEVNLLGVM